MAYEREKPDAVVLRQVFRTRPWILPRDPEVFVRFFEQNGHEFTVGKGGTLPHGGEDGYVSLLVDGLVSFAFLDVNDQFHIFALVLPGRLIGGLDSLNPQGTNVVAECMRTSRVLRVPNSKWRAFLRESVERMELFADLCVLKEECELEGTFANFTLDLESRLRVFMYSLVRSCHVEPDAGGWYQCPLSLTVTEIAQIVSANRSWVSTKFSEWCRAGVMQKAGNSIACREEFFSPINDWMETPDNVRPRYKDLA